MNEGDRLSFRLPYSTPRLEYSTSDRIFCMKQVLVFTDLDGTLLDHDTYSYAAASKALFELKKRNIPVILNSSKTMAEMKLLRQSMELWHPFIIENGGAVCVPQGYWTSPPEVFSDFDVTFFGVPYEKLIELLDQLRAEHGYQFQGFHDISSEVLSSITGLSKAQAQLAQARLCSEPVQWKDSSESLKTFQEELQTHELQTLQGGRFMHIQGIVDKGLGVRWLIEQFQQQKDITEVFSIGLGDSPNDLAMLSEVDIPVVVRGVNLQAMQLEHKSSVIYTSESGPRGWQEAIDSIINDYF